LHADGYDRVGARNLCRDEPMTRDAFDGFKAGILKACCAALAVQAVVIVGAFALMLHFGR